MEVLEDALVIADASEPVDEPVAPEAVEQVVDSLDDEASLTSSFSFVLMPSRSQ